MIKLSDAPNPSYSQNTEIIIPVNDDRNSTNVSVVLENSWHAKVISVEDKIATIEITSSPKAIIGEWKLSIDTRSRNSGNGSVQSNSIKESIFLLFNPWNKSKSLFLQTFF